MNEVKQQPEPRTLATRLDRAIFSAFPRWGAKRMATRRLWELAEKRATHFRTHEGADTDRFRGANWLASNLSPDSALEDDLETLRERSHDLYANDCFAAGAIDSRVANEIGCGIRPQARIRECHHITKEYAAALNKEIEAVVKRWCCSCGTEGESLWEIQRLLDRTWAHGDAFLVLSDEGDADSPIPLKLEVIAAERVETPPSQYSNKLVRLGIKRDAKGRIEGYYVRTTHPGDTTTAEDKHQFLEKDRVLHLYDKLLPGQSRGKPWLSPVMGLLYDIKSFAEATLISARVEACFSVFVTGLDNPAAAAISAATDTDGDRRIEELEPGVVRYLAAGQDIKFASPNRPGGTFGPYMEWLLRSVSAGINFCYEMLTKSWQGMNYSGGRLALIEMRNTFSARQQLMRERILVPLWKKIVDECVIVGAVDIDPSDYSAEPWLYQDHAWIPPGWPWVDPQAEVAAATEAVNGLLDTRANQLIARGMDPEEMFEAMAEEKKKLIELGLLAEISDPEDDDEDSPPPDDGADEEATKTGKPVAVVA